MQVPRVILASLSSLLLTASLATGEGRVEKNVVYGTYSGLALLMDVYYPETPKGIAVVVIPGSGWQATMGYGGGLLKDHPLHDELVDPVVSAGFTAFVLSHRQAPTFQYPAAVEDVQRAVRYVRYHAEDFDVNPDSIGVVGHSSGGHLAAMLGVLDGSGSVDEGDPVNRVKARVQAVVTVAAPTDLAQFGGGFGTPYVDTFVGAVHLDAGGEPHPKGSVEWQLFHDASPISWVSTGDAPMLLFHGDQDAVVPVRQAEAMTAALQAADVTAEFVRIPEGGHVWAEDWVSFPKAMVLWFDRFLKE